MIVEFPGASCVQRATATARAKIVSARPARPCMRHGVICSDCLTLREQRAIRVDKARVIRRLKRGLPAEL